MHYHILLTEKCNSQCKYCYEKSFKEFDNKLGERFKFDFSSPEDIEFDLRRLKKFFDKDKDPVLVFYGGEPLLKIKEITQTIDILGDKFKYRMQTNGKLLRELPIGYLKKIGKILVSIDGDKERTDYNKGKGTYDLVLSNLDYLREEGYKGEIVARMTISPEKGSDLFEQVKHLVSWINRGIFNSIHWQIDAGFYKFDFDKKNFSKFVLEYNQSISKLINWWLEQMKAGKVYRLYPFIAIIDSLLKNEQTKLRCGAGHSGYAITTSGKIVACPIMNCIEDFEAGTINDNPKNLLKFEISSNKCRKCAYFSLCGGRCLYWKEAKLWPEEGDELICKTIKHYIEELKSKIPQIKELIEIGRIKKQDFEYEKYFGPEIIP